MDYIKLLITLILSIAAGYGLGYVIGKRHAPTETKVEQVVKTETRTIVIHDPSGRTETVTEVINETSKITDNKLAITKSKNNISAMVAADSFKGSIIPIYGISVNREFLGPFTVGAFGMQGGLFGVSLGMNF